jgi:hypothetical protein
VYFDGVLGKSLVKIIPFNHPLTLLDLQTLKEEIESRDDDRNIVVVCLGKESSVDPWVEEHNKNRPINKIEVIELRSDEKYGKFIIHQPAQAEVDIKREEGNIAIKVEEYISPTIVDRFEMDTPLFKAKIPDWRSLVDCILIDLDYGGEPFCVNLSDTPGKKDDLVTGEYILPAPKDKTTVAVKIIDMLGEETIISKTL